MANLKKIIGINVGSVVLYMGSFTAFPSPDIQFLFAVVGLLLLHTVGLIITAIVFFVKKQPAKGKAFLLSALLVLVVGVSLFLLKTKLI